MVKRIPKMTSLQGKRKLGEMASGKDVVLPCVVAVFLTLVSKDGWIYILVLLHRLDYLFLFFYGRDFHLMYFLGLFCIIKEIGFVYFPM
ncbi:Aspartate--tRNA(Asp/Asn) ligase [Actinidia chinensis var. chinensis]|uniref:Aspartate--tRNA(Asp/Asn) ligase n=1 Tax=Actinidia chinensis var. chinensis TaxID=1590841 RepID=A0A2R6QXH2_ACTCC|nr:Aspartate--tRNA(Asp/Asn) ligase [Actinidia chinensis var. chinensis]